MKNIAIMVCNKVTCECAGVGCFKAFNEKSKAFEIYKNEDVKLCGFFHCNGCGKDLNKELDYKINQLHNLNVDTVHMALCIDVECSRYSDIEDFLKNNGFTVVRGSH